MIETYFSTDSLSSPNALLWSLILGLIFGFILERAGFASSRRLSGIFYFKDMSVLKVMFTAVLICAAGLSIFRATGMITAETLYLLPTILAPQILGGFLFGIGFVMSGWCPGTAAVGFATGSIDSVVFLVGAFIGGLFFNEIYPSLTYIRSLGNYQTSTIHEFLGMTQQAFLILFTMAGIMAFWISEIVENKSAGKPAQYGLNSNRSLKLLSILLLFLAIANIALVKNHDNPDNPTPASAEIQSDNSSELNENSLLKAIDSGLDHISPSELAENMMNAKPMLLIDLRDSNEFNSYHIPGAVNLRPDKVEQHLRETAINSDSLIVLYSNGMVHPAQTRDSLSRRGFSNLKILTDGLQGFLKECLMPSSLRKTPVTDEERIKIDKWRKFFSGPRIQNIQPDSSSIHSPDAPSKAASVNILLTPPTHPGVSFPLTEPSLIDAEWLARHLEMKNITILDLRPQPDYNSGHIPGSLSLNPENLRSNIQGVPASLLPAKSISLLLSYMGISDQSNIILIHGGKVQDSTLMAIALERVGHIRYAILDGGYQAWIANSGKTDKIVPQVESTEYTIKNESDQFTVRRLEVSEISRKGYLIDARPRDYYMGEKSEEARAGHIPGAVNRPYSNDTQTINGAVYFKPATELSKTYTDVEKAVAGNMNTAVYCRTGHQASQSWFILTRLLSLKNIKWYDGSWTDWAADPELKTE
jgi:thiosulfate/3-mercaptopyruvate sulfurtransferase